MRRYKLFALALAGVALASSATAQTTSDFSAYASPTTTEYQAGVGAPVTSGVIDFYDTEYFISGARNVLGTWGNSPSDLGYVNRPTNIGGGTAMFATQLGEEIDLFGTGSDFVLGNYNEFNIFSMDVGHLYSTQFSQFALSSFTFTVSGFGTGTGNNIISQSFAITAPPAVAGFQNPLLQTLTFDSRWHDMSNVWWSQSTGSGTAHQFTNVVASLVNTSVVPEPSTYVMMFAGLLMVGVARRRSRLNS